MAEIGRKYLIRDFDGNERGPYTQKQLLSMAANGELMRGWKLRSEIVANWRKIEDVDFLHDKIPLSEVEQNQAVKERYRREIEGEWTEANATVFAFTPASLTLRVFAGITDALLLGIYALLLFVGMVAIHKATGLDVTAAFYLGFTLFCLSTIMYLTWSIAYYAQSLGQWYWGILVVRKDQGKPVFMGRAFVYVLGEIILGWTAFFWIYALPSKRGLHDVISRTRVVRIRNITAL